MVDWTPSWHKKLLARPRVALRLVCRLEERPTLSCHMDSRRKVVVRRLPPELAEDDFKSMITKNVADFSWKHSFWAYYQGKVR